MKKYIESNQEMITLLLRPSLAKNLLHKTHISIRMHWLDEDIKDLSFLVLMELPNCFGGGKSAALSLSLNSN